MPVQGRDIDLRMLFPGDGAMAAEMRAKDWRSTPLGPPEAWPHSLRTVIGILLTSRFAMWMAWGPKLTFFCNDAYRPTLGMKQAWALGAPSPEVWKEIWGDIGPRVDAVLETGQATWDEDLMLFLERSGFREETYHTFSYSPLAGDNGAIEGMLCVVSEETERVIGERRLATLGELASQLAGSTTEADLAAAVTSGLEGNRKDLPFTMTFLFDADGQPRLACATGLAGGAGAAFPETVARRLAADVLSSPLPLILSDAAGLFHGENLLSAGAWDQSPATAAALRIDSQSQDRPAGFLVAGLNPYRQFDKNYSGFVGLLAGQIAAGLANVRAYEAERRRAEALAAIDRAKTAFFSNVSHEFRTPLTLMLGPLEEALRRPSLEVQDRADLATVQRNGLRLLRLVNSLLDFSRVEAGRITAVYHPSDLAGFTAELASSFRSACARAGVGLDIDCEPLPEPVFLDRDMWEKIVLNLVSNAFKFTFEGGISVKVKAGDGHAVLRVGDTGTGIPQAELPRIFERFHRVEGAAGRTHEGTGIGLALVQELVRLHGGSAAVESTMGRGTAFTIRIPFGTAHLPDERIGTAPVPVSTATHADSFVNEALRWLPGEMEAAAAGPAGTVAAKPGESAKVLIADDNADMRDYLNRLLVPRYEVAAAGDGRQALEMARASRPDLILTDIMMPRLDGFGLVRALRGDPDLRDVPVVMLSARAGEDAQVEGLEAGADDYLVKPFSARELLARVQANLDMSRLRRDARQREHELRTRLETVIAHLPVGVGVMDLDGRYILKNAVMQRYVGDVLPSRDPAAAARWRVHRADGVNVPPSDFPGARALRGEPVLPGEEMTFRRDDGSEVWTRVAAVPIHDSSGAVTGGVVVISDIGDLKATEAALRDAKTRLEATLTGARVGTWTWQMPGGRIKGDRNIAVLLGVAEEQVRDAEPSFFISRMHPEDQARTWEALRGALVEGGAFSIDTRVRTDDNAVRWVAARGFVRLGEDGSPRTFDGVAFDITERKRGEEHQRLLINELNHRVKNTLATVQAIVAQTLRGSAVGRGPREAIEARLIALSRSHNLLTREKWEGAELKEVALEALDGFGARGDRSERFAIDGPRVRLRPAAGLALSMAFHELATNAAKYGALSNDRGTVAIAWTCAPAAGGERVTLSWQERGGPPVSAPARRGFGTRLIEQGLATELDGTVALHYLPEGVSCRIEAVLPPAEAAP